MRYTITYTLRLFPGAGMLHYTDVTADSADDAVHDFHAQYPTLSVYDVEEA